MSTLQFVDIEVNLNTTWVEIKWSVFTGYKCLCKAVVEGDVCVCVWTLPKLQMFVYLSGGRCCVCVSYQSYECLCIACVGSCSCLPFLNYKWLCITWIEGNVAAFTLTKVTETWVAFRPRFTS